MLLAPVVGENTLTPPPPPNAPHTRRTSAEEHEQEQQQPQAHGEGAITSKEAHFGSGAVQHQRLRSCGDGVSGAEHTRVGGGRRSIAEDT